MQSLRETTGLDKYFLHPTRGCLVVAPSAERWIFYDIASRQPLQYSDRWEGKEVVRPFDPEP
jgi:hypothetical protein